MLETEIRETRTQYRTCGLFEGGRIFITQSEERTSKGVDVQRCVCMCMCECVNVCECLCVGLVSLLLTVIRPFLHLDFAERGRATHGACDGDRTHEWGSHGRSRS